MTIRINIVYTEKEWRAIDPRDDSVVYTADSFHDFLEWYQSQNYYCIVN